MNGTGPEAGVRYAFGDVALLVGPAPLLSKRRQAVHLAGLRPVLLCTGPTGLAGLPRGLRALAGPAARVRGWLGAFRATLPAMDGPVDIGPLSYHADGHFDWVLDFTGQALAQHAPPGYYSLDGEDFSALKLALREIAGRLRGGYAKPRHVALDASRCAHRRQEIPGCQACLSSCPAGAIHSAKDGVEIEPHLCRGCGTCVLNCPAGAVRYIRPTTEESLARLQAALAEQRRSGGSPPGLWIAPPALAGTVPAGWLAHPVDEPASLDLAFWLTALATGAVRVAVACTGLPGETRAALAQQLAMGRALLVGLGWPGALDMADEAAELDRLPALPRAMAAPLPAGDDKRALLFHALDVLAAERAGGPVAVPLPAAAPLGGVTIAADACTLCGACVRICPSGALEFAGSTARIAFTEQPCLQCGLCRNVCPEKAVTLTPRLLVSAAARQAPRIAAEAELFACNECGAPFAPRALVERSRALMADHPMFQGDQARLMACCPDCRQRAMAGASA